MHSDKRRIQLNGNLMFKPVAFLERRRKSVVRIIVGSERRSQKKKPFVCDVKTKEQFIVWKLFTKVLLQQRQKKMATCQIVCELKGR